MWSELWPRHVRGWRQQGAPGPAACSTAPGHTSQAPGTETVGARGWGDQEQEQEAWGPASLDPRASQSAGLHARPPWVGQ